MITTTVANLFTDTSAAGGQVYQYYVAAMTRDGVFSRDSDTAEIFVGAPGANRPPSFAAGAPLSSYAINEGDTLRIAVAATDPDGQTPTVFVLATSLPDRGIEPANGQFLWPSTFADSGHYTITFGASDGTDTATATV